jgi:hypothetical protein
VPEQIFGSLTQKGSTFTSKAACYAMIGAAHGALGRDKEAMAAFETSMPRKWQLPLVHR